MAVLCKRVQATSKATAAMQSQWCCYWPSDWIVGVVAMDCETTSRQWDEDLLCLQQWCWRLVMMVIGDIDLLQVLSGGVVCLMSLQHLATGYWLIFFFFCVDQVRLIGYDLFFFRGGGVCRVVARWLKVVTVDGVQAVVILIWLRNTDWKRQQWGILFCLWPTGLLQIYWKLSLIPNLT